MKTRNELKAGLINLAVNVVGTTEEFDGGRGGLWVTLEEGALADYDGTHNDEYVQSNINKYIEDNGYYIEEYDPGTAMIWPK